MDKMSSLDLALREMQLELEPVTGRVSWCSSNPKHPRNWSLPRKVWDIGLIVLLEVYTCVRSNITMKSFQHLLTISIDLQLVLPECVRLISSELHHDTNSSPLVHCCEIFPRKTQHKSDLISIPFCLDVSIGDAP